MCDMQVAQRQATHTSACCEHRIASTATQHPDTPPTTMMSPSLLISTRCPVRVYRKKNCGRFEGVGVAEH